MYSPDSSGRPGPGSRVKRLQGVIWRRDYCVAMSSDSYYSREYERKKQLGGHQSTGHSEILENRAYTGHTKGINTASDRSRLHVSQRQFGYAPPPPSKPISATKRRLRSEDKRIFDKEAWSNEKDARLRRRPISELGHRKVVGEASSSSAHMRHG